MKPQVLGVIPARLGSRRFPDKVLYPYRGKPLLFYIWDSVRHSRQIERLVIATDNSDIRKAAESFGAEVVMTAGRHRTGSDRVAEVAGKIGGQLIVNIQGDALGMNAKVLDRIIGSMKAAPRMQFATLAYRIRSEKELRNPDVVKVVADRQSRAVWFSRSPLPYLQNGKAGAKASGFRFLGHIGVYLFRRRALEVFSSWPRGRFEKAESLEQLRILENGKLIHLFETRMSQIAINSPDDLKKM